ncbi:SDR family oxidoreductase [Geosporobacter ferrireducens]|uniref:SDR family oxidoreductase n=1 Tax=Geosporobacter ferrireducens TaxID=1424294 RepID=UPI00139DE24A|nr:SDR family oxidoreductase [Geosporobacter ferrireducens]MTI56096.1 SDR family oxidoreductase [Geosporobacter ferrireducens]
MQDFSGKVVLVTGGGQGIGMAISRFYAQAGAQVVIADFDEEAALEHCKAILSEGYACEAVFSDVGNEDSVKKLMHKVGSKYGKINVLINNAALHFSKDIESRSMQEWQQTIDVNLTGPYMCVKYVLPYMKQQSASIVNIASTRALMSEADTEPYSASKGGLLALTHSLAVSLGKYNIRVNAISPGWIDVSAWRKSSIAKQIPLSEKDHRQHPAGRVGKPEDIARACLFLTSDEADFITGSNLVIDGGMTVKMIYEP